MSKPEATWSTVPPNAVGWYWVARDGDAEPSIRQLVETTGTEHLVWWSEGRSPLPVDVFKYFLHIPVPELPHVRGAS